MTPRERFHAVMAYGAPDRAPLWAEGLREEVRQAWARQGLPLDTDLASLFEYDARQRLEVNLDPRPPLSHPPLTVSAIAQRRRHLDPRDPQRLPGGPQGPAALRQGSAAGQLVELPLGHGLFLTLGVAAWASFEPVLLQLADAPALVGQVMQDQAAFTAEIADTILGRVPVDFASFSEPIADNHGPLISPAMFRDLVLPAYRPVLDVLRRHQVDPIVWVSYGNPRALLGQVLDAGFNCLWAIESESPEMDYRTLRRHFGRSLRLIGGIDLDCLRGGPAAIDAELQAKVPPLLTAGGYVPLADGRVRPNLPWAHYAYYRRQLQRLVCCG